MNKKYLIGTIILSTVVIGMGIVAFASKGKPKNTPFATPTPTATIVDKAEKAMENKLKIEDQIIGTGEAAVSGKKVIVNYVGTLTDGAKFDSSYDRNQTFSFTLGAGEVIQGWDLGVVGMKVGGKRKLTIPSSLGYGPNGIPGVIPGNSTLIFEVELVGVE